MDSRNTAPQGVPRNVLLVDDSAAVRSRLADLLVHTPGVGWVAQAGSVADAQLAIARQLPEVVVLDVEMPGASGLELLDDIRARGLAIEVIMLTNHPTAAYRNRCLELGADHFLDKTLEFQRIPALVGAQHPEAPDVSFEPRGEMDRLLSLFAYEILETPAEQAYDDITALAAYLCGTPVGLISLVDADRQWFKSRHGLQLEGTDRTVSFCSHAIEGDDLFVVEDARVDRRFADNPLVQGEQGVVFYAGMPIEVKGGHKIGTLCVIDHVPRQLDDEQRAALRALARQAVSLLELRRMALDLGSLHEQRTALERELETLSTHDSLTGLENRHAFRQGLGRMLSLATRQKSVLACLYLDLDNFKLVNDSLGHAQGDYLLVTAGQRVKHAIRATDLFARLGGDEFGLVLADVASAEEVAHVATKLRALLTAPYQIDGHTVYVGCSIGISLAPDDGTDIDTLLRHADIALYHAKGAGKGDFRFYAPDMNERVVARMNLEAELRVAVTEQQFTVSYQPQIACGSDAIVGVEALLRWPRVGRASVGPNVFVALAEELHLGAQMGTWVLEQACAQFARWRAQGVEITRLAVNVSASQLVPEFVATVMRILAHNAIRPEVLELEIIENQILHDIANAERVLSALRTQGVRVALDDFGTGYSSLSLLRELKVDALKIDRAFVQEVADGNGDTAIVSAMIALAHRLGLSVTAEGVEQPQQLVALRAMGCDDYQGFLASPALAPETFHAFYCAWPGEVSAQTLRS